MIWGFVGITFKTIKIMDLEEYQNKICVVYKSLFGRTCKTVPNTIEGCKIRLKRYQELFNILY